jgi:hypothetical protein
MADERDKVLNQAEDEADEADVEAHKLLAAQDAEAADDDGDEPDVEAHKLLS